MCSELDNAKGNKNVFFHELAHHLPYGILAVACALLLLSFVDVLFHAQLTGSIGHAHGGCCSHTHDGLDTLFHAFHFIHLVFAASGAMLTFYRYSNNIVSGIIIGTVSSSIFCTLSDVLLPYIAGLMLGVDMDLHICFTSELGNILPFLFIGVVNGLVMKYVQDFKTEKSSLQLHFFHTFISAVASIFYAVGHGLHDFHSYLGIFFLLMVVAVILPCTLADVVAPIYMAKLFGEK